MIVKWIWIILVIAGLWVGQKSTDQLSKLEAPWVELPADDGEHIDARLFKTITFGHWLAASDLLWVSILADPSTNHTHGLYRPKIYYDLVLLTDLDPLFLEAYLIGGNLLATIRDDGVGAADLLSRGVQIYKTEIPKYSKEFTSRYWKSAEYLPTLLGYVQLFDCQSLPAAIEAFELIRNVDEVPGEFKGLVREVLNPARRYILAGRVLEVLMGSQTDMAGRQNIEKQQQALATAIQIDLITKDFDSWKNKLAQTQWRKAIAKKYPDFDLNENGRIVSRKPVVPVLGMRMYESISGN